MTELAIETRDLIRTCRKGSAPHSTSSAAQSFPVTGSAPQASGVQPQR